MEGVRQERHAELTFGGRVDADWPTCGGPGTRREALAQSPLGSEGLALAAFRQRGDVPRR